jgi:hypothetical protein
MPEQLVDYFEDQIRADVMFQNIFNQRTQSGGAVL